MSVYKMYQESTQMYKVIIAGFMLVFITTQCWPDECNGNLYFSQLGYSWSHSWGTANC